jgi:hypothetical protein
LFEQVFFYINVYVLAVFLGTVVCKNNCWHVYPKAWLFTCSPQVS